MYDQCFRPCPNKTDNGFCKTTTCINPLYSNIGTAQYGQGVQKRIITNADRIRSSTDEELAEWVAERSTAPNCTGKCHKDYEVYGELRTFCHDCWLDWLKQEAET